MDTVHDTLRMEIRSQENGAKDLCAALLECDPLLLDLLPFGGCFREGSVHLSGKTEKQRQPPSITVESQCKWKMPTS